jgi:hypothetical protein
VLTPIPTPTPAPIPLESGFIITDFPGTPYTTLQRDTACESDPPPDYGFDAFHRYELPLLWTFQLNFDVTSDGTPSGRPLGCLRLYERNEDLEQFDAIDGDGMGNGILVDTCKIPEEEVTGPPVVLDPAQGIADFDGRGGVECRMHLAEWMLALAEPPLALSSHAELLEDFPSFDHNYPSFTIVAVAASTTITDGRDIEPEMPAPLVYYAPPPGAADPIDFSVKVIDNEVVTFPLGECPSLACPSYPLSEQRARVWWYDFLSPDFQYASASASSRGTRDLVPAPTDSIPQTPDGKLPFWVKEAVLYIGFNPVTGIGFHGTIDSIIIDPPNSKGMESQ